MKHNSHVELIVLIFQATKGKPTKKILHSSVHPIYEFGNEVVNLGPLIKMKKKT